MADKPIDTSLLMTREQIIEAAAEREFVAEAVSGNLYPARLVMGREFPRVVALGGAINEQVSWVLAERLATGKTTRVKV